MISNEQGRCCGHVALVGVHYMFGESGERVRITIQLYVTYFRISVSFSAFGRELLCIYIYI